MKLLFATAAQKFYGETKEPVAPQLTVAIAERDPLEEALLQVLPSIQRRVVTATRLRWSLSIQTFYQWLLVREYLVVCDQKDLDVHNDPKETTIRAKCLNNIVSNISRRVHLVVLFELQTEVERSFVLILLDLGLSLSREVVGLDELG